MKLESQCVSLELAQKLKALGVKQESYFEWWHQQEGNDYGIFPSFPSDPEWDICWSAFTVAELGEMLPNVTIERIGGGGQENRFDFSRYVSLKDYGEGNKFDDFYANDIGEADARALMLIHLIETGALKP